MQGLKNATQIYVWAMTTEFDNSNIKITTIDITEIL